MKIGPVEPRIDVEAWRRTADALPIIIFTARGDGCVEFVNERWTVVTGQAPQTVVGSVWADLAHPEDRPRVAAVWRAAIETGGIANLEFRVRRTGDGYFWVTLRATPMRSEDGNIVRWYGTVIDIDARVRVERGLQEREAALVDSERRFRVLAEAIPVICWTADASGWIDWYNQRWYDYTGQTPEEAAGWGWQAAHHPEDFLEVMRRWPNSIVTGEPFEMEFRLRRHDGAFHWFLTRVEPLRDNHGQIIRWYGSNVDIDAQKRALERTKRIAETLQDVFLPKKLPKKDHVRLDAVYLAAEKDALIGGDWFDAFELADGRLVFSMGDVAGHGLDASVIAGSMRQAMFTLAFDNPEPAAILRAANRILAHQEPGVMVTALVGIVDNDLTSMTFASAGHPPPLVAENQAEPAKRLPYGGPPLGVVADLEVDSHTVAIARDAVVVVYTDGMVEFTDDLIGAEKKLRSAVALLVGNTSIGRPAIAIKELVFDGAPPRDDAALLLLQFSDVDEAALRMDPSVLEKTWRFHSSHAHSATAARREVIEYLKRMAVDQEATFNAELVIGEILANTVEHAPGPVEMHVDWTGRKPVLTVRDTGPGLTRLNAVLPDVLNEGGRGTFLIKALSEATMVKMLPGYGTELRVVLPIARSALKLWPNNNRVRD